MKIRRFIIIICLTLPVSVLCQTKSEGTFTIKKRTPTKLLDKCGLYIAGDTVNNNTLFKEQLLKEPVIFEQSCSEKNILVYWEMVTEQNGILVTKYSNGGDPSFTKEMITLIKQL